jgi:hypothetical protein
LVRKRGIRGNNRSAWSEESLSAYSAFSLLRHSCTLCASFFKRKFEEAAERTWAVESAPSSRAQPGIRAAI